VRSKELMAQDVRREAMEDGRREEEGVRSEEEGVRSEQKAKL
jgi:hypothetical protein